MGLSRIDSVRFMHRRVDDDLKEKRVDSKNFRIFTKLDQENTVPAGKFDNDPRLDSESKSSAGAAIEQEALLA